MEIWRGFMYLNNRVSVFREYTKIVLDKRKKTSIAQQNCFFSTCWWTNNWIVAEEISKLFKVLYCAKMQWFSRSECWIKPSLNVTKSQRLVLQLVDLAYDKTRFFGSCLRQNEIFVENLFDHTNSFFYFLYIEMSWKISCWVDFWDSEKNYWLFFQYVLEYKKRTWNLRKQNIDEEVFRSWLTEPVSVRTFKGISI